MGYTPAHLNVRKVAGGFSINPGGVTTDDLAIYANAIDVAPVINLLGNNAIQFVSQTGASILFSDMAANRAAFGNSGTDYIIESLVDTHNLYLKTTGTGKLKFGTHTGSGDVACNGSIAILDSAGNARKVMTTA
jgi:hypothetical protein